MGTFIAIEGTDGAGKGTQTALLKERLERLGREVLVVDFPRYGTPIGAEIRAWLDGKTEWTPFEAAAKYAADRRAAAPEMHAFLARGGAVVANRYLTSNIAHQGARLADPEERRRLYAYVFDTEYGEHGIPKPDLTLVLHVTVGVSQANVDRRGTRDRLEADPSHLRTAEEIYLALPEIAPTPVRILECMGEDGVQLSKEAIHHLIWKETETLLDTPGPA